MPLNCAAEVAADKAKGVRRPLPSPPLPVLPSCALAPRCASSLPSTEPWWLRALRRRLPCAVAPLGVAHAALALAAVAPRERSVGTCSRGSPRPGQLALATARHRQGARSSARPAALPTAAPLAPCTSNPLVCMVCIPGQLDRPIGWFRCGEPPQWRATLAAAAGLSRQRPLEALLPPLVRAGDLREVNAWAGRRFRRRIARPAAAWAPAWPPAAACAVGLAS